MIRDDKTPACRWSNLLLFLIHDDSSSN